ncbi:MAG: hypothetical protein K2P70_01150 [Hyphomonadaceae bacterium]|nr:hypothetical protein [Hyphomonadaceae bacterium]
MRTARLGAGDRIEDAQARQAAAQPAQRARDVFLQIADNAEDRIKPRRKIASAHGGDQEGAMAFVRLKIG